LMTARKKWVGTHKADSRTARPSRLAKNKVNNLANNSQLQTP
jgi:hypothetical protein